MKALSVRQPWANLIASGVKTIEIRTWKTKYRGNLLICASKKIDGAAESAFKRTIYQFELKPSDLGVAVCVANLIDCRRMNRDDTQAALCNPPDAGAYAWVLEDVKRIKPFHVKGQLGLFEVEFAKQNAISQTKPVEGGKE